MRSSIGPIRNWGHFTICCTECPLSRIIEESFHTIRNPSTAISDGKSKWTVQGMTMLKNKPHHSPCLRTFILIRWGYVLWSRQHLKVLCKSIGLCRGLQRAKANNLSTSGLLVSVWSNHLWKWSTQTDSYQLSPNEWKYRPRENTKESLVWAGRSVTVHALTPLIIDNFAPVDYLFQSFCNIWVSKVTPSGNYFTISPHNLTPNNGYPFPPLNDP